METTNLVARSLSTSRGSTPIRFVFEQTQIAAPIEVVQHLIATTHGAPLDGAVSVFYEFFVSHTSDWWRSLPSDPRKNKKKKMYGCELFLKEYKK